jgi:hypothetical protein
MHKLSSRIGSESALSVRYWGAPSCPTAFGTNAWSDAIAAGAPTQSELVLLPLDRLRGSPYTDNNVSQKFTPVVYLSGAPQVMMDERLSSTRHCMDSWASVRARTPTPRSMSASEANSSGRCEKPPAQGMKTMALGTTWATKRESW